MEKNPYVNLPESAFWRLAVADKHVLDITELWSPKIRILPTDSVATYGSCFAQHIGARLVERGYQWLDAEPAPYCLSGPNRREFNYGIFSARTANIYTTSLLYQWVRWAEGSDGPPDEVWYDKDRVIDPFRPRIEPKGFASVEEMQASRAQTIHSFRKSIEAASVFVFTLGLTESWKNAQQGYEYPMCPGTTPGCDFDPDSHSFVNQSYPSVMENLERSVAAMRAINPEIKILLTVSPVPLTATKSEDHVLLATTYSKSVLRAVAGDMCKAHDFVDYFPSYEIFTSAPFRGLFYDTNLRSASPHGVAHAMGIFFNTMEALTGVSAQGGKVDAAAQEPQTTKDGDDREARRRRRQEQGRQDEGRNSARAARPRADVVCEEELLEAFSR